MAPPLHPAQTPKRNVLFVILESVRADATCIDYDPDCRRTEATNKLFPHRFAFPQMRSMDSTTAVSLAVLWSGLGPTESRDNLHTWPLLFDYARAAGYQPFTILSMHPLRVDIGDQVLQLDELEAEHA